MAMVQLNLQPQNSVCSNDPVGLLWVCGALQLDEEVAPAILQPEWPSWAVTAPERSQPTMSEVALTVPYQPLVDYPSLSSPSQIANISGQIARQVASEIKTEVRQEIRPVLDQMASAQECIEGAISTIYHEGTQAEGKILPLILSELRRGRKERAEIAETVESLRRWARSVQRSLPSDASLRAAIEKLAEPESRISAYQYIEANLPLIPGIIHYKVEIGPEHKAELLELWRKIMGIFLGSG